MISVHVDADANDEVDEIERVRNATEEVEAARSNIDIAFERGNAVFEILHFFNFGF